MAELDLQPLDLQPTETSSGLDLQPLDLPPTEEETKGGSLENLIQKGFLGRAADVAGGLLESLAMPAAIPSFIGGQAAKLYQYGKEALGEGITPETEKHAQALASKVPQFEPETETGKFIYGLFGDAFDWAGQTFGTGVATLETIRNKVLNGEPLNQEEFQKAKNVGKLFLDTMFAAEGVKGGIEAYKNWKEGRPEVEKLPSEEPPIEEPPKILTDQMPLDLQEMPIVAPEQIKAGFKNPYILDKTEIDRLENELNPPVEERVPGQGELFTGERPYQPGENPLLERLTEEPRTSHREDFYTEDGVFKQDALESPGTPWLRPINDTSRPPEMFGGQSGERAIDMSQALTPEQLTLALEQRRLAKDTPIDFETRGISEFGTVVERRAAVADEAAFQKRQILLNEEGVPYTAQRNLFRGPGGKQRGGISMDLATFGLSRILKNGAKISIEASKVPPERTADQREVFNILHPESPGDVTLYAKDANGNIAGYLDLSRKIGEDFATPRDLHVREDLRRQGVATELYRAAQKLGLTIRESLYQTEAGRDLRKAIDPFLGPGAKQRGALSPFGGPKKVGQNIVKKGIVGTMLDYKTQFSVEKRSLPDLISQEKIEPTTLTDLASSKPQLGASLKRGLIKGMSNVMIDKAMSILTADKGPIGKIIKWGVDSRRTIDNEKELRIKSRVTAILDPLHDLEKKSKRELNEMRETWLSKIGSETELTRADFKSDAQYIAFQKVQEVIAEGADRTDKARELSGMGPIARIKNYFPSFREGSYWIQVKDGSGTVKWAQAFKNVYEANKAFKVLQKEWGKDFQVDEPYLRQKGLYDLEHGFTAFEEMLRTMSKDDPVTKTLQRRYAELQRTRGFGKTAIHRKGIAGALGFEKGELGAKNMKEVLETYIKRQESYIANLEKARIQAQLDEMPQELRQKMPLGLDYLKEYLDASRGADLARGDMVRALTDHMTEAVGFGRGRMRDFTTGVSSLASLFWLMKPKFIISQPLQALNSLPKLMQMKGIDELVRNPAMALMKGYDNWYRQAPEDRAAVKWAQDHGYLDSTIVSLLQLKLSDLKGEKWGMIGDGARWFLGKVERDFVRGPSYMMFEYALRDSIKDPAKRYETASELMDWYMVHYDMQSSPLLYNKLGIVGEAARPLKQYSHNTYAQFFEYIKTLQDHNQALPLATHLGVQALVGGLKGLMGIAEVTAIIQMINMSFDTDIPTPLEALLRWNAPDTLIYGGASTAMGYDISSSVGAPSLPNMIEFPAVSFVSDAFTKGGKYLVKKMNGTATDSDLFDALIATTPAVMRGFLEELFTPDSGIVPMPGAKGMGVYRRSEEGGAFSEKNISEIFSVKSMDEAKKNDAIRSIKQVLKQDAQQKLNALDAIVDQVRNGKDIDENLLTRFVQEGGDINNITNAITNRMRQGEMTWDENQLTNKQVSPAQIHRLQIMKEILDSGQVEGEPATVPEEFTGGFQKEALTGPEGKAKKEQDWKKAAEMGKATDETIRDEVRWIQKKFGNKAAQKYINDLREHDIQSDIKVEEYKRQWTEPPTSRQRSYKQI